MEQNQNSFAVEVAAALAADKARPEPAASSSNLPVAAPEAPPPILEFDPVALRARFDGWTPERQRAFIEELADCGIVREAAARVGMTEQSATRLRRRADAAAFSLAWDAALALAGDCLHAIAWERAVLGTVKPRFYRGEKIGEERVFDNRLLTSLIARLPAPSGRRRVGWVVADWEGWMKAIEDGLEHPPAGPDESDDSPVFRDEEDGSWWTRFAPPFGFDGVQCGAWGEADYRRSCTRDEIAMIEATQAREEEEEHRRRDAYFARLK